MQKELVEIIDQIKNRTLRKVVRELVLKPTLSLKTKEPRDAGLPLLTSPAAKTWHHSYPMGLLEHMISTSRVALALCDSAEKIYGGRVDRDLVLAGVLLHDVFKPMTYVENEDGTYGVSPLGERLDHLTLVLCELYKKKVPIELLHILASHHGRAGPISPRTIEALIVHVADVADATLNGEVLSAAKFLAKKCTGEEVTFTSSKEAFEIVHAKQAEGCEGVIKVIEKIRKNRSRRV